MLPAVRFAFRSIRQFSPRDRPRSGHFAKQGPLRTKGGVVAVHVEDPAIDVAEQLLERAWLPGFSDSTREPLIAGD
jgi:hypothetical protein